MAIDVLQGSAALPLVFQMVQSSDHHTPLTGAVPTVVLSKNGGIFGAAAGAVSEIGNGWYQVAGNAVDTNTPGNLILHATAASADPSDSLFQVIANIASNPVDQSLVPQTVPQAGTSGAVQFGGD